MDAWQGLKMQGGHGLAKGGAHAAARFASAAIGFFFVVCMEILPTTYIVYGI